jgi:hypothetical protein
MGTSLRLRRPARGIEAGHGSAGPVSGSRCAVRGVRGARRRLHPASLSRIVRRLDLSRQKTRPLHPLADERAKAAFAKRGCAPR